MRRLSILGLFAASCGSIPASPGSDPSGKSDDVPVDGGVEDAADDCKELTIPLAPAGTHVSGVSTAPDRYQHVANVLVPKCSYSKIELKLHAKSTCPMYPPWPAGCDPFARIARISRVDMGTKEMMLLEGITSYGAEATFVQDITDYYPALVGNHTYRIYVSTASVVPQTGENAGYDIQAELIFTPGKPSREAVAVQSVFWGNYGPTASPFNTSVTAPMDAKTMRFDLFSTGHGSDYTQKRINTVSVDGTSIVSNAPWRQCTLCTRVPSGGCAAGYVCGENPVVCPPAVETSQAGWCPAQIVQPLGVEHPAAASGEHEYSLSIAGVTGYYVVGGNVVYFR